MTFRGFLRNEGRGQKTSIDDALQQFGRDGVLDQDPVGVELFRSEKARGMPFGVSVPPSFIFTDYHAVLPITSVIPLLDVIGLSPTHI